MHSSGKPSCFHFCPLNFYILLLLNTPEKLGDARSLLKKSSDVACKLDDIGILLLVYICVLICNICSTELKSVKVTLCYKAEVMKSN